MAKYRITHSAEGLPGSSLAFKTGNWRDDRIPVHHPQAAPCHAVCPAGENPQAWLALVEQDDLFGAWRKLVEVNPLPAITGRVCPHPCETGCNRGQYDEAISMHGVERFLGDEAIRQQWAYDVPLLAADAPRVAVVGAGPGGLSAAYHLRRLGHRVTLIEREPVPGGILRTALPAYRLPRDVLDSECERLLAIGIDCRFHTSVGRDVTLQELHDDYAAVFLAPGAQQPRPWSADGATPGDLHPGLRILNQWTGVGEVAAMKSAAVIGGGNTAIDVARVLRRAGVAEVHVITHREMPAPDLPPYACMTANPREIEQAIEEGVTIHAYRGVTRLVLKGGHTIGVEMVHMKRLYDSNGRLQRVPFEGTETVLHVDQVIPATGQQVDPEGFEELLAGKGAFAIQPTGETDHAGIYAGGDAAAGGEGTVAAAIGDGRRAAQAIHARLNKREPQPEPAQEPIAYASLNLHYYDYAARTHAPMLPVEQRQGDAEVEGVIGSEGAAAEAKRCFSCGQCLACDNCWSLCPDNAVLKTDEVLADGSFYVFDYDYCKGCGICAVECPCGFIEMAKEG